MKAYNYVQPKTFGDVLRLHYPRWGTCFFCKKDAHVFKYDHRRAICRDCGELRSNERLPTLKETP